MKVAIIIPHYKTWKWTSICINAFKKFPIPIDHEIIVCDNSVGHRSIECLTKTSLGDGVTIVPGDPELPSHGHGYELCMEVSNADYIFTSETDSFPTSQDWFAPYLSRIESGIDLVGAEVPQSSGRYIHPAGALYSRKLINAGNAWIENHKDWWFCSGMGIALGLSDRAYHVVAHKDTLKEITKEMLSWRKANVFQEMRCFDEDTFENYSSRTGIKNWEPTGKSSYLKIGFEAGQWLAYFAQSHNFNWEIAPMELVWMREFIGGQAEYSTIFNNFIHVWCGTSSFLDGIPESVKKFKMNQMDRFWFQVDPNIRKEVHDLEQASVSNKPL